MDSETELRRFVTANGRKEPLRASEDTHPGNRRAAPPSVDPVEVAVAEGTAALALAEAAHAAATPEAAAAKAKRRPKFARGPPAASNSTDHGCATGVILDFTEGGPYFQDFAAQAAAVAQCDVLLGPHGAGMMHLVWMTRPARAAATGESASSGGSDPGDAAQATSSAAGGSGRATFTGAVVELLGLTHEGRVTHMYYYEHLAALAGLEYVLVSSGDPSTYVPVVDEFEDLGLTPNPDLRILAEALRPLCAAADGSGPPLRLPPPGAKFGKEVAATVWHDMW
jgi:hypothetical protein